MSQTQSLSFIILPKSLLNTDPYTQAVYSAIKAHFPNPFPSIRRIASMAKCSHVTVIRRIKQLILLGFLKVVKRKRGQANLYEFPDHMLTHHEQQAKRAGRFEKFKPMKLFSGLKKAVNLRTAIAPKVVNQVSSNKNKNKQEDSYLDIREAAIRNPDLLRWMRPLQ